MEEYSSRQAITNVQLQSWMRNRESLSKEEEKALFVRYLAGDGAARTELIERNMRLVVWWANKYSDPGKNLVLDMVQEGVLGLHYAIERFDPERGYRFSSFASWWIRYAMSKAYPRLVSPIKLPATADISVLCSTIRSLEEKLGRMPSLEELVEATGMRAQRIQDILPSLTVVSLDEPITGPENETLTHKDNLASDAPGPHDDAQEKAENETLREAVMQLPSQAQQVIVKKYGLHDDEQKSDRKAGQEMGLSHHTVHKIHEKAIRELRQNAELRETFREKANEAEMSEENQDG